jgi:hypothetical protein
MDLMSHYKHHAPYWTSYKPLIYSCLLPEDVVDQLQLAILVEFPVEDSQAIVAA